jgi:hypothetical protein
MVPILMYVIILWLLFKSNRIIIQSNKKFQALIMDDLMRLNLIQSLLLTSCNNPLILEMFNKIKTMGSKDLPKNEMEFINLCRIVTKEFHGKIWAKYKEKFENATVPEEKIFFGKRVEKLSNVLDLLESVDENSSLDFMKLIAIEIQKVMSDDESGTNE